MGVVHRFIGQEDALDWEGVTEQRYDAADVVGVSAKVLVGPAEGAPNYRLRYFRVEPGGSTTLTFPVRAPETPGEVAVRVVGAAAGGRHEGAARLADQAVGDVPLHARRDVRGIGDREGVAWKVRVIKAGELFRVVRNIYVPKVAFGRER